MRNARFIIVGGGLSGLHAAALLEHHGVSDYLLIEARDAFGGRILSPVPAGATDRIDLGPTWFWPAYHRELDRLIAALQLDRFAQHDAGAMMAERAPNMPPARMRGFPDSPKAMRLTGGMVALIDALRHRIDASRLMTGERVRQVRGFDDGIEVESVDASGNPAITRGQHLLLAVPPRLASESIDFSPALPPKLQQQWQATPTWMADHAKYVAVYDTPFWRTEGLSGEARSATGPLAEIHDAGTPGGIAALFGFFGVPARVRQGISHETLRTHCRAQLARLFGPQAAAPRQDFIKDWATDPLTATAADLDAGLQHHAMSPAAIASAHPWKGRMTGIASEWSLNFPGYVAGAIDAATQGVVSALGLPPNLSSTES